MPSAWERPLHVFNEFYTLQVNWQCLFQTWINNKILEWLNYIGIAMARNQKIHQLKKFLTFSQAWQTFAKLEKVSDQWRVCKTDSGQLCQEKQVNGDEVVKAVGGLVLTRMGSIIGVSGNTSYWCLKKCGEAIVELVMGTYTIGWDSFNLVSNTAVCMSATEQDFLHVCWQATDTFREYFTWPTSEWNELFPGVSLTVKRAWHEHFEYGCLCYTCLILATWIQAISFLIW